MSEEIININSDDIIENLENLCQKSNIFKTLLNINSINCYIFYLNNNELHNYKKYEINIKENKLSKKELLNIILSNVKYQNTKYDLVGIYKFEIQLEHNNIKDFCKKQNDFNFVSSYKNIQDIKFKPGIELFNDNNSIILFFSTKSSNQITPPYDKKNNKNKTKKKVSFNLNKNTTHHHHNKTLRTKV
jgi:hypothetical protein